MSPQTEALARNVLALDETVPRDDIDKAMAILNGGVPEADAPLCTIAPKDVAALLSVSRRTVYRYLDSGSLERVYDGHVNSVGVSRDSYVRLLEKANRQSQPSARSRKGERT